MPDYDAFLLVSFGGPEGPADVMPFLQNVTHGRGVPAERLAEVAHHYEALHGVSPLNQQCRDLLAAIGAAGIDLPLYWGNRNWRPQLADTVAKMAADGVRHAIAFVTSGYGCFSSCRQYLDDIEAARASVGPDAPRIDKIRHFFNHPGFIEPFGDAALAAIESLAEAIRNQSPLVFTAHSIPDAMAAASGPAGGGLYQAQLAEAARLVAARVSRAEGRERPWRLVYQSRSGPPAVPWLGPDVCDHLAGLARAGARGAVLVPVSFVSDHVEVVYDLDVEAAREARRLGLAFARAVTPGTDPRFVSMITELVRERREGLRSRRALGSFPPAPDFCPNGCCRAGRASAGPAP